MQVAGTRASVTVSQLLSCVCSYSRYTRAVAHLDAWLVPDEMQGLESHFSAIPKTEEPHSKDDSQCRSSVW